MGWMEELQSALEARGLAVASIPGKGRGLITTRDFAPGDVIIFQEPYASTPNKTSSGSSCDGCFASNNNLRKCSACQVAWYCGTACQVIPTTAMDNYDLVVTLESHISEIDEKQLVLYAQMANLVNLLSCNAHTICDGELRPLGTGLYPVISIINHSCVPNSVLVFENRVAFVRAMEPIAKGTEDERKSGIPSIFEHFARPLPQFELLPLEGGDQCCGPIPSLLCTSTPPPGSLLRPSARCRWAPPPMDRKANLPLPPASIHPTRTIAGDANLTSSSSSSSSSSFSPPDFLRQAHAVFKRHRPLGGMQSNMRRATRVLVPQTESSKNVTSMSSVTANVAGKVVPLSGAVVGARRVMNTARDQGENDAGVMAGPADDASLTPPSVTGTTTTAGNDKASPFGLQNGDSDLLSDREKSSLAAVSSSQVASSHALTNNDMKKENLAFQKMEYLGTQVGTNDQDLKVQDHGNIEVFGTDMKFGGSSFLENTKDPKHNQCYVEPMTRCSAVGSSCVTTLSVHTGPTIQSMHAQPAGQTAFPTQVSSSAGELPSVAKDHTPPEEQGAVKNGCDWHLDHQQNLHLAENVKDKGACGDAICLPSHVLPTSNPPSSNIDVGPSQSNKVEKSLRKKKYDPNVFFKVNGKLYQKLGKIGSGGSSEVQKVISSDCTIYALKKIKLKGRDYPTAYGFCQEIEYLKKLKGMSNIIQLIDYEVTDKTLFQEVVNGSMNIKEKRIKDDECIYMVLEFGEIDLAHMLAQKWKEMSASGWKIDENWLRFYWQQMLEAVSTIHEERIVHSDLKPANFLLVRGSLKLIDFGIAKAIMSDTTNIQRDAQVGTLNYMSPEAFMCNEPDENGNIIKCGRPSDIWSLGCILYQMVYGKTPFAEYKTFWAKFKVVTDRNHEITYEPVSNPWLVDIMRRCLAWDRNERWRIPQLLQHPFLVPRLPRELPPCDDRHPCKLLMERVGAYWSDPQVSRLCSELYEVIAKLEKVQKSPTVSMEPNVF
ncbi:hypothetical protein C4D60_Mb03t01330 [Musa balbisiana]|uniref:Protein kinase domain-containing protein n=1 Tax=Musa balbisiana TaxID=52838 RepID=A0A4S8J6S8_MUSBA|nr:hypothetical protein C4D60_Mb03t01330 [Musa balbisiana]